MLRKRILGLLIPALALCLAAGPAAALSISVTRTNSTTHNDDDVNEVASASGSTQTANPVVIANTLGNSGTSQVRFAGQASAANQTGGITQSIDVTATFTITPDDPYQVYSITFSPAFHGRLQLFDDAGEESGDTVSFSSLNATLALNSVSIADTLNMTGTSSRTTSGATNVDRSATQTLTGLSGVTVFALRYTGTAQAIAADGLFCNDRTGAAALWGQEGSLSGYCDAQIDSNDNYATTAARDSDGLFIPATVTITTVPEPGTLLLLGAGLAGLVGFGSGRRS